MDSSVGGVAIALVGAVALVAGVRGVYGKIWTDLTAGTGPQVADPSTAPAAGPQLAALGSSAARIIGGAGSERTLYTPQTPNGQYIAGAGLPSTYSSIPYAAWSLAAGAVNAGARLLTSYNAAHDYARWSYAQNASESSWEHYDRLRHDLMKNYGWSIQQASDEVLREMYAVFTAQGGNWAATGFGPVNLSGLLRV
jgi:hypothetical protein